MDNSEGDEIYDGNYSEDNNKLVDITDCDVSGESSEKFSSF